MCGGPEHSRPVSGLRSHRMTSLADDSSASRSGFPPLRDDESLKAQMSWLDGAAAAARSCSKDVSLLELAADNDLEAFRKAVEEEAGLHIDEEESWYVRRIGVGKMAMEKRTPLMIAALYGSVEVLGYILKSGAVDVNRVAGEDSVTALHCAAAGGSARASEVVRLLLAFGANKSALDAQGRRPADVVQSPPSFIRLRGVLDNMLLDEAEPSSSKHGQEQETKEAKHVGLVEGKEWMSSISSACTSPDSFSPVLSPQSPSSPKYPEASSDGSERKEYPVDPSLPDIKNSIYTTDEFRMFSFKVRPCSRAYSHDWTECPFVHPGENARRRDPRKFHYSCVPCPDFRKGACRRGDACEYAHGVFECWLHPAQYRTRLCKEGTSCNRRVCFFAHTSEEMRPLIVSSGTSVPSPRASSPLDVRSMSPPLSGSSQPSVLKAPTFSPSNAAPGSGLSTPPLSPSSLSAGSWSQQPSVPALLLPAGGSGLHSSRLRAALSARDMQLDDYARNCDLESMAAEFTALGLTRQSNKAAALLGSGSSSARMHKFSNLGLSIPPTNLQDIFSSEVSPMSQDLSAMSPQLQTQLQLQQLLSPLTSLHQGRSSPQLQSPGQSIFAAGGSPRSFSSRRSDLELQNAAAGTSYSSDTLHARKAATYAQRDNRGSWSLKEATSMPATLSDWGSPSGKPDWGVQGQELGAKFGKSASFSSHGAGTAEPDLSWVQTLVRDGPSDGADVVDSQYHQSSVDTSTWLDNSSTNNSNNSNNNELV